MKRRMKVTITFDLEVDQQEAMMRIFADIAAEGVRDRLPWAKNITADISHIEEIKDVAP